MSKKLDYAFKALDVINALGGNPYQACPKCGKKCYCQGIDGNDIFAYGAIRKTIGFVPYVGKRIGRFAADHIVHPTYDYYCYKCDYEWQSKYYDG